MRSLAPRKCCPRPFRVGAAGAVLWASLLAAGCGHEIVDLATSGSDLRPDAGVTDSGSPAVRLGDASGAPAIIRCSSDDECKISNQVCSLARGRCVECTDDTHCTRFYAAHCDVITNSCAQCLSSNDCPGGTVCDPTLKQCGVQCTSSAGCFAPLSICDSNRGVCVECQADVDCGTQPFIAADARKCVLGACLECVKDADCHGATPYCESFGRCVECLQSSQCSTGDVCDAFEHRCQPSG